jgi:hypothetical protein
MGPIGNDTKKKAEEEVEQGKDDKHYKQHTPKESLQLATPSATTTNDN